MRQRNVAVQKGDEVTEPIFSFYPIPFSADTLPQAIDRLGRLGYTGVELPGDPDAADLREALAVVDSYGMVVTSICPRLHGPDRDLSTADLVNRRAAVDYFHTLVEMADTVSAPVISIVPTRVGRVLPETSRAEEWGWAVDSIAEIAAAASPAGIRLAIEPWNRYETYLANRIEDALRLRADIGVDNVGIMADLFHMNIEETSIGEALEAAGGHLLNTHFADSNRRAPGRGHIDIDEAMTSLHSIHYRGPISVEYLAPKAVVQEGVPLEYYDQYAQETIAVLRESWNRTKGAER